MLIVWCCPDIGSMVTVVFMISGPGVCSAPLKLLLD